MPRFVLIFFVIITFASLAARHAAQTAQKTEIPSGQVIEKIACLNESGQSYALYLPSTYTKERKWPILFAFDPRARGKIPVEHFKEAAEKYGWIVVGSNNSRNGPPKPSVDAWNAVSQDIQARFAIDKTRAYMTGFSGGARMAVLLASYCRGCVVGVIGCGAGFPTNVVPSASLPFVFFSTIGIDDFNFAEVKTLDGALTQAGIAHRVETFAGRHEWAPSAQAVDAVEWMELQAMKAGKRARDAALIEGAWLRMTERARSLETSKDTYGAYQIYADLSQNFKGLRDVTEVEKKLAELRADHEVKAAMREEQQQITKQRELEAQIGPLLGARQQSEEREEKERNQIPDLDNPREDLLDSKTRLQGIFARLQKSAKDPNDTSERRIARRVLDGTLVGLFEQGLGFLETQKRYDDAAKVFRLATEVNPESAGAFFYLAWAYAAGAERKKSLLALKTAVAKGFSDAALISETKAFDSIRSDPQYEQIIQPLRKPRSSP